MQYAITFLEGLISFISPCMLPMLPLYISYFAGNTNKKGHTLLRAAAFVLGFTLVFTALGLFAGTLGAVLTRYRRAVNLICGIVVILFGLSYLEVINLPFFKGMQSGREVKSVFSAFLFGVIYSVSLTPCVGAFLGSALMMASTSGKAIEGAMLLLAYSLGLGVPFLFSAALIDQLSAAFGFIIKHYRAVNAACGVCLIILGVLMASGRMSAVISTLM